MDFSWPDSITSWKELNPYLAILDKFYESGFPQESPDDTPLTPKFFIGTAEMACNSMTVINSILQNVITHTQKLGEMDFTLLRTLLIPSVIIGSAFRKVNMWTTDHSIKISSDLLNSCCQLAKCESLGKILAMESLELAKFIFKKIQPKLSKSNWSKNPSYCTAFMFIIKMIKAPVMSQVLNEVLPVSLLFLDDFIVENQLAGIECITRIVDQTPASELKWYSRANVLYDALDKRLYTNEEMVVLVIYPCMLKVLKVVEADPKSTTSSRITVTKSDRVYERLLGNMEREDVIRLRRAYAKRLTPFIEHLGLTTLKQMKKTVDVILAYLEVGDGRGKNSSRRLCLVALNSLIKLTKPRISKHLPQLLKGLVRLSYDTSSEIENNSPNADPDLLMEIKKCLKLLRDSAPTEFNELCLPLLKTKIKGLEVFSGIITKTTSCT